MTALRTAFLFASATLLAGCGSTPESSPDPEIEAAFAQKNRDAAADLARRRRFEQVLNNTDRMLERYMLALLSSGSTRATSDAATFEKQLTKTVDEYYALFMRAAIDKKVPRNRAISLAVLGMSGRREALDPMLNGLEDDNPEIVTSSVFGIALLKDGRTPPSYLHRVIDRTILADEVRNSAAWALVQVQMASVDSKACESVWTAVLGGPIEKPLPGVAVSALRGVGLSGNAAHNETALRYLAHPKPKVREAAAIAVGRLGVAGSHAQLFPLISPAEGNPNVRLAARKALKALAGGTDRGYDLREWQRLFERG